MKFITLLVASCLLLTHVASASSSMIERVLRSVVLVSFSDENTQEHICTGFVIDAPRGYVMTARHCIAEGDMYVDAKHSEIVMKDDALAILRYPPMSKPPLDIRKDIPQLGERLYAFGFGRGLMRILQRGVAGEEPKHFLVIDGPLIPGMSGGPVVDLEGKLVGVNQGTDRESHAMGLISDVDAIRHLYRQ